MPMHKTRLGHPYASRNKELVVQFVLRGGRRERDRLQDVTLTAAIRADEDGETSEIQGEARDGLVVYDPDLADHLQSSSGMNRNLSQANNLTSPAEFRPAS